MRIKNQVKVEVGEVEKFVDLYIQMYGYPPSYIKLGQRFNRSPANMRTLCRGFSQKKMNHYGLVKVEEIEKFVDNFIEKNNVLPDYKTVALHFGTTVPCIYRKSISFREKFIALEKLRSKRTKIRFAKTKNFYIVDIRCNVPKDKIERFKKHYLQIEKLLND